jgi:H+/Cl- antiporter ClcA
MLLSSLMSISAGGSLGPEAPMVQVTGSLGTWVADHLHLQGEALRSLSLAGMAAGFTALFGAPLGGRADSSKEGKETSDIMSEMANALGDRGKAL